ncbi:MAG: starch-binding protein, partial [Paludibacteraceae bacterium]|nr:starch-binding protein [Paludibacteraceae bacterium]
AYLKWMKGEMGYDGWRYDLVKGYLGKYTKMYNNAAGAYLSVGEYWEDSYDDIKKWIQDTGYSSMAFDFPFKYAINNWGGGTDYNRLVWAENRVAGLAHSAEMRQYAITFIDNHDTASPHDNPQEYYGDKEKANAIMLANAGIPCVFWPHWVNHKAAIKKMIAARKSAGIHSNSEVKVTCKNGYFESVAEGKNGTLICRVGSWSGTPAGYEVACSGNGWAYYIKGGKPIPVGPVVTMNPAGGYVGANGKVTLTTTKGTIYYTTNGTTPSASSTKYTGPITITANNTTIKAIAIDGTTKSSVVSGTFLTEKPAGLTVEFKAPAGWTTVNLYAWAEGEPDLLGKWPGKAISKSGDYYTYTITETDTRPLNIIFNDGTNQTADITSVSADACYDGTNPSGKDAKGYIIPGNCSGTPIPPVPPIPGGSITLKVKASSLPWGNTCYVHAWNGAEVEGGTNVNYTGAWPGQAMTLGNDGYYTYTLQQDMVYALFNDGKASNGQQTDDVQRITASTCYEISSDTHPNMMQKEVYTAIETDCPTTGIDDIYATNVAIYPNPTSGKAIIASDKEVKYVSISNLSGWTVAASTSNEIDLSGLASAMYLVNIEFNDGSMAVSKIIKK